MPRRHALLETDEQAYWTRVIPFDGSCRWISCDVDHDVIPADRSLRYLAIRPTAWYHIYWDTSLHGLYMTSDGTTYARVGRKSRTCSSALVRLRYNHNISLSCQSFGFTGS